MTDNTVVSNSYQELLKEKEKQAQNISALRENIVKLEQKITDAHVKFTDKDIQNLKSLSTSHSQRRQEHLSVAKRVAEHIKENIRILSNLDDNQEINNLLDQ